MKSKESVEEFLKRGGQVSRLPYDPTNESAVRRLDEKITHRQVQEERGQAFARQMAREEGTG